MPGEGRRGGNRFQERDSKPQQQKSSRWGNESSRGRQGQEPEDDGPPGVAREGEEEGGQDDLGANGTEAVSPEALDCSGPGEDDLEECGGGGGQKSGGGEETEIPGKSTPLYDEPAEAPTQAPPQEEAAPPAEAEEKSESAE